MANEPTTTITGNLTDDPALRFTPSGVAVASFTIANTPRTKNSAGEWSDGETWFVRCSAWRDLGQNIAESLTRGAAVVATGRLTARSWDHTDQQTGQTTRRTAVEMTVDDLGPSLRRATARPIKTTREHPDQAAGQPPTPPAPPADDPWATSSANTQSSGFSADPPF
jgi:single-strand DNA-binding protein